MLKRIKTKEFRLSAECKAQLLLVVLLFISCLIIFRDYIFGNEVMVYNDIGEDTWQLYTMHYASIVNHLRDGTFSLWDFTNGFGTNLFNLNLFDPSLMILYFLGFLLGPAHMLLYLVWIQVIKILVAGFLFYRLLSLFTFSRQAKLLAAFAYGLNGYLLVWGQHYQFGMVTVYFPLMLVFAEKFLRREKGRNWFPVCAFLCGIYSVYFTYMIFVAVGIYLLFRCAMMGGLTRKARFLNFLSCCGQMLLGLGMSLVVFLPMTSVLINVSNRLEGGGTGILDTLKGWFDFYPREFYESLFMRLFSTNLQTVHSLADGRYEAMWNYYEDPIFFCSTLSVLLNIQFVGVFWKSKVEKKNKVAIYAASVLMLLTVILKVGGTIFNAFTVPTNRYTFVLIPFFLIAMAWMWDYLRDAGKINGVLLLAGYLAMNWAYRVGYGQSVFREYRTNAVVLAVTGEVMVLCLIGLMILKTAQARKIVMWVLAAVLVVNVVSESLTSYEDRICLRKEDTSPLEMEEKLALYHEKNASSDSEEVARASLIIPQNYFRELYRQDIQDALAYLKRNDKEFHRVEKNFMSATFSMDSLAQGYRGISTYNSVMNKYIKAFVDMCYPELYYKDQNHYAFWDNAQDNWFAAFAGIRYLLSMDGNLDSEKYKLVNQFGDIYLYKNVMEAEMAQFYNTAISEESFKKLCRRNREELLEAAIALEGGEQIASMSELRTLIEKKEDGFGDSDAHTSSAVLYTPEKDSFIKGRVSALSDGYVLFKIPYEQGWSLTVDGKETELLRGDIGFLACRVEAGDHEITLTFRAPLLKEGAILSLIFWIIFGILRLFHWYNEKVLRRQYGVRK